MRVRINSLVELDVGQIKISGKIFVAGKELPAGVNKTLDAGIIEQLPSELVSALTSQVFGADYTPEELATIAETLTAETLDENQTEKNESE